MIEKHQQANGIGRGKITINPEYIKRAGEITVGGLPIKVLSSNPNTGRVLAQFPDGHIEEVKAAPDYFIGGNTSTKELKNNLPVYGETNTAANERADSLDEAHDLTPIFSNLITAGQISTMNEGALDLLNGKYLEGTTKLFSPAMFGSGIGGVAARSVIGGYNLFNKNGVRKTYNLFNLGHYGEGALSLLGDAFNVAMATEGLGSTSNALKGTSGYRNWRLAREINKAIKNKPKYTKVPSKNLFRALVYKGGEITDPYSNFVTTDPLYAANYGKVTPYIFESRSVAKAKEPMMGYSDPVTMDMFIYNNTKRNPNATAIIGHDAVTGEFTPSKGTEILNMNPKNLYPIRTSDSPTSLKFFERKPSTMSQITTENAASITPEQWIAAQDAAYKNAVMSGNRKKALELLDEAYKRSGVPETIVTMDSSGRPKIWYTGSEYGNHTVFDSSKFNATIGGESAVGKIKGNFLTTDLPSAARYAGSGVNKVKEFTEPSTFLEKLQNIFGMYKPERIHPTDKIPETLRPKPDRLFTTKDAPVVDYLDETDNVVYPMYVNPGERVYTVDFKGNPWSRSPIKFPNSFSIKKTIRDDIAKTYRDEIVPFKDRETAIEYYKSLVDRFGKRYVEDPAKLAEKKFPYPGGDRSIEMFASAPSYEKASLIETHTPATTNGAVQTAAREGYTSVYMPNVIDSNVRSGVPYAIDDFVTLDSRQMKMADITYDDAGNLIPLSERFNWNNPDIRYGLLPFGIGLTGYGLYKRKLGGKMNILEFLKNGSGIYIKPKNRGKFTKYCHGKVTNECILKGKNSSNPTIRKRATFADNARHFKHKSGGLIVHFVKGINVLDTNPTAYKYVKKKYKMALEGTKLTFGLKVSNVGNWINNNLDIVNTAVNGITGLISANKKSRVADQFAKAKEAEMKSFKEKTWKEKYMENLLAQEDRSDVVNMSRAYNQTSGDVAQAVQEKLLEIDSQIAAAQLKAAQARGNAWGGILKGAGEIAMNALASNGIPKSKTSPTSLTGLKTSSFGGMNTPQFTSPQTNYSFLK